LRAKPPMVPAVAEARVPATVQPMVLLRLLYLGAACAVTLSSSCRVSAVATAKVRERLLSHAWTQTCRMPSGSFFVSPLVFLHPEAMICTAVLTKRLLDFPLQTVARHVKRC